MLHCLIKLPKSSWLTERQPLLQIGSRNKCQHYMASKSYFYNRLKKDAKIDRDISTMLNLYRHYCFKCSEFYKSTCILQ